MAEHHNATIITLTETHLKWELPIEFSLPNYNCYHTHRTARNGGRVLHWVSNKYTALHYASYDDDFVEVDVVYIKKINMAIIVGYFPLQVKYDKMSQSSL